MSPPVSNGRRAGASELLRALGLLVDGPAQWTRPVPSRRPGVFVVELPNGLPDAPIDIVAVRRWLERVPEMKLDGETATPADVAKRLHEFWLPNEPVLYVGRSARAVGARVSSMYATPLGDAKPYSAGHWLRTLSVLPDLRVWWADTDAHEEYEDALLSEIAARNASEGRDASKGALLPFANLMTPEGVAKAHGLSNSLRTDDVAAGASAAPAKSGAATTAKAGRASTTKREGAPRARRPPQLKGAQARPAAEPTFLSREGLEQLAGELEELRNNQRPQIIARVKAARELGDLRENADYEYARKEQSFVEGRILMLEQMVRTGVVIERDDGADSVRLGSTVDVESEGERVTYVIVGSTEAKPAAGRLSNNSPVGRALLGARAGDEVNVDLPSGSISYRVLAVR
jgi:transcription elongation factor GreA